MVYCWQARRLADVAEANQARLDGLRLSTLGRSQMLNAASQLYRWSKEQEKPDAARMLWTMDKVDGAQRLLTEMGVK